MPTNCECVLFIYKVKKIKCRKYVFFFTEHSCVPNVTHKKPGLVNILVADSRFHCSNMLELTQAFGCNLHSLQVIQHILTNSAFPSLLFECSDYHRKELFRNYVKICFCVCCQVEGCSFTLEWQRSYENPLTCPDVTSCFKNLSNAIKGISAICILTAMIHLGACIQ